MPELPEVEITKQGLSPLLGQTVSQVIIRHPRLRWPIPQTLITQLPTQTLHSLSRRAKYILAQFNSGTLLLHLGMSGRIQILSADTPVQKHNHFEIHFTNGQMLRLTDPRRFGAVLWLALGHELQHPLLQNLGPEPLADAFSGAVLFQALRHKKAPIKTAIMDGHIVVGVGNIYASESLFRARINPKKPAQQLSLSQCDALVAAIKSTLSDALKAGGSSLRDFYNAEGKPGYFQQSYFVYGRTGLSCHVCATPIAMLRQGQRATFYCPHCQA